MTVPDPLSDLDERLAGIARRLEDELDDDRGDGGSSADALRVVVEELGP